MSVGWPEMVSLVDDGRASGIEGSVTDWAADFPAVHPGTLVGVSLTLGPGLLGFVRLALTQFLIDPEVPGTGLSHHCRQGCGH